MHPSFEQFVAALRDPAQRPGIGLAISDDDAATLLTNATWANDYYARWIAMFPPAASGPAVPETAAAAFPPAASPAAAAAFEPAVSAFTASAPASAPPATPSNPFGPPPGAAATSASPYASADVPSWAQSAPRRSASPARIALIAALAVVTLAIIAGVTYEVAAVTRAPVAAKTPAVSAPASPTPSTPINTLPEDLHGLCTREYPLMEAIFESHETTIPIRAEQGMTDAQLRAATDAVIPDAETACAQAAKQPNGFDDPDFKSSFVAGYVSSSKATPENAALVYDAIAQYCVGG